MKKLWFVILVSLLFGFHYNISHAQEAEQFSARFKAGKGVELASITKSSLGIETVAFNEEDSLVPFSAVLTTIEGKFIYVVNGKHYLRTQVEIEEVTADSIKVISGLYAGDELVISSVNYLWYAELQAIRGGISCADGH